MKHNWEYKPFSKIARTITPISKIDKVNYHEVGNIPIVSQEECEISGYWNESDDITPHKRPVIVFGDHSRVLKYIDYDFVVGADGVKIIEPFDNIKPKFIYHYLLWYNVPSLGYARHFKLVKEAFYPVPSLMEQEAIVAELDAINGLIATRKEQLKELDNLAHSLFYDTFGDPISNPKGWEVKKLGGIAQILTGATPSRENNENFCGNIPWVKTTEVQNCYIYSTEEHITQVAIDNTNCKVFPIDSILIAMYGQGKTRGQIARLKIEAATNQACAAILPSSELNQTFLYSFLLVSYEPLRNLAVGCNQKNLNLGLIKGYNILLPPLTLQHQFAGQVEAIEAQKAVLNKSLSELQTLLESRMDYWFN